MRYLAYNNTESPKIELLCWFVYSRAIKTEKNITVYVFSCMFILLSQDSDKSAVRARLGVVGHLYHTKMGESR